ncbi:hypothetical protein J2Y45_003278 [Dyadobacter sp. BE34]|uniref:Secretion system C-terminal sorting domain-containing protein n=1 Tax=Dyadobacter fermentans TaxID=94254 RepID=A0ABU1QY63_9BACT|nr:MULTISPECIES: T9SS type A sorting domain-containing protein [Dyadobacter]MDR6806086.1 hypothetical protein [Dyadobacter fermentans]MDR7043827.1 hypothetical protein [Dyadobacter sp. BE242]MDR7198138.1 hypothetical protein [Dyadobacter sp. BE34]MDR7216101.1 hypothetical protein [Dyadobacter sp. BE31]MDR7264373.1 hypothetical protein [Dyadobacter sp. BE32]
MRFTTTFIKKWIFPLMFAASYPHIGLAQWQPTQKIVAADRENLSVFGSSVAISGDYAVVGALGEDDDANGNFSMERAGAAYIFHKVGSVWVQVKKITAPVRSPFMLFGTQVAFNGETLVVSAPYENISLPGGGVANGAGAVYIFQKDAGGSNAWGLVKKITSPQPQTNVTFGNALAISGDYVLIGVPYETDVTPDNSLDFAGAAYLYKKDQGGSNNWGLLKRILSSDRSGSDQFGKSVAISGDKAIVGAMQESHDANGSSSVWAAGSAYIFEKNNGGPDSWGQIKKITAPVRAEYDYFGTSVSIDGDYAVVGASQEDEDAAETNTLAHSGSAYIFKRGQGGTSNWGLLKKVTATKRVDFQGFGGSVSLKGNHVVIGANTDDNDANDANPVNAAGSVFIFENSGNDDWAMVKKLVASSREGDDSFGYSVALEGKNIIVGASSKDDDENNANSALNAGAAFVFTNDAALPVRLTHFTAEKQENQADLTWSTAEETNSSHFEIQRSGTSHNWTVIGTLTAANESRVKTSYHAADLSPLPGENLYRLKMVDTNGTFAYSSIKRLFFEDQRSAPFYPNPVGEQLLLDEKVLANAVSVKLLNQAGQQVFETSKSTSVIKTGHLNAGTYLLQVVQKDGSVTAGRVVIGK